jgi:hypothetical protein
LYRYYVFYNLQQTLLRVLDSFLEEQRNGLYKVHIKLLDIDNARNEPTDMNFDFEYHTAFQDMATCDKKVSICTCNKENLELV